MQELDELLEKLQQRAMALQVAKIAAEVAQDENNDERAKLHQNSQRIMELSILEIKQKIKHLYRIKH